MNSAFRLQGINLAYRSDLRYIKVYSASLLCLVGNGVAWETKIYIHIVANLFHSCRKEYDNTNDKFERNNAELARDNTKFAPRSNTLPIKIL